MKKITAFKLSNGEIVTDENEAILKEKELSFEMSIKTIANNYDLPYDYHESFVNTLIENKYDLMKYFLRLND